MPTTNNASNVSTGKPAVSGAVYIAPLTASLPTSATAAITGFTGLGYVSEDGLVNAQSFDSESVKAWGGDTVAKMENNKEDTFRFTLIEAMNANVLKAVFGDDNVSGSALSTGYTIKANAKEHETKEWVFDMILKGNVLKRITVPMAAVSEVGAITYKDDEAIGYEVTITCFPDSSGNTHYEYIQTTPAPTPEPEEDG